MGDAKRMAVCLGANGQRAEEVGTRAPAQGYGLCPKCAEKPWACFKQGSGRICFKKMAQEGNRVSWANREPLSPFPLQTHRNVFI